MYVSKATIVLCAHIEEKRKYIARVTSAFIWILSSFPLRCGNTVVAFFSLLFVCLFVFCFVPFLELRSIRGNVIFILRPLYSRIYGNVILIFAAT